VILAAAQGILCGGDSLAGVSVGYLHQYLVTLMASSLLGTIPEQVSFEQPSLEAEGTTTLNVLLVAI
jgi:hypothetical protein